MERPQAVSFLARSASLPHLLPGGAMRREIGDGFEEFYQDGLNDLYNGVQLTIKHT